MDSTSQKHNVKVIAVEGLLGVGKSTLIEALQQDQSSTHAIKCLDEQVNPDFLALFYKNPQKYAFAFQYATMAMRIYQWSLTRLHKRALNSHMQMIVPLSPDTRTTWYVCDRTMIGDYIFAQTNYKQGNITDDEMKAYISHFGCTFDKLATSQYVRENSVMLFLMDTPSRCKQRVETWRGKNVEKGIPLSYFEQLDWHHMQVLLQLFKENTCSNTTTTQLLPTTTHVPIVLTWDQYTRVPYTQWVLTRVQNNIHRCPQGRCVVHVGKKPNDDCVQVLHKQVVERLYHEMIEPWYKVVDKMRLQQKDVPAMSSPNIRSIVYSIAKQHVKYMWVDEKSLKTDAMTRHVMLFLLAHGYNVWVTL